MASRIGNGSILGMRMWVSLWGFGTYRRGDCSVLGIALMGAAWLS